MASNRMMGKWSLFLFFLFVGSYGIHGQMGCGLWGAECRQDLHCPKAFVCQRGYCVDPQSLLEISIQESDNLKEIIADTKLDGTSAKEFIPENETEKEMCQELCTVGEKRCSTSQLTIEQCKLGGCGWEIAQPCHPNKHCENNQCICTETCKKDETQCLSGQSRTCVEQNGCPAWSNWQACSDGFCQDAGTCGTCQHQCDLKETRCQSDQFQTCTLDVQHQKCRVWGAVTTCPYGCASDNLQCRQSPFVLWPAANAIGPVRSFTYALWINATGIAVTTDGIWKANFLNRNDPLTKLSTETTYYDVTADSSFPCFANRFVAAGSNGKLLAFDPQQMSQATTIATGESKTIRAIQFLHGLQDDYLLLVVDSVGILMARPCPSGAYQFLKVPGSAQILALAEMGDPTKGIVIGVGTQGTVMRYDMATRNDWNDWKVVSTSTQKSLFSVELLSRTPPTFLAGGADKTLLFSNNGGASWQSLSLPGGQANETAIVCKRWPESWSGTTYPVVVIGQMGSVWTSIDGTNWKQQPFITPGRPMSCLQSVAGTKNIVVVGNVEGNVYVADIK